MDNGVGQYRAWGDVFDPRGDVAAMRDWDDAAPGDNETHGADSRSRRILIVDDDVNSAEMLAELLGAWGHSVEIAEEGRSAIESALTFAPQIILLDIDLPWLDGYEIARLLRGDGAFGAVRIIALTGYQGDEYKFRSLKAGFDFHLTKPIDIRLLRSVIDDESSQAPLAS